MMGEKEATREVARRNINAMLSKNVDYIITLCASCASHLKVGYGKLFEHDPSMTDQVRSFTEKVYPFSAFLNDVLKIKPDTFQRSGKKTTYHAPCHLCRGLGISEAPHALIEKAGFKFCPALEEETCCGFGGTYSSKFPNISAQILARKLDDFNKTGADLLVTECPGCVMQLKGGVKKRGDQLNVMHIAEALEKNLKK